MASPSPPGSSGNRQSRGGLGLWRLIVPISHLQEKYSIFFVIYFLRSEDGHEDGNTHCGSRGGGSEHRGDRVAGGGGIHPIDTVKNNKQPDPESFPISETGPWPKAIVPEPTHEFGTMATGSEKSHAFTIKNAGDVPLQYKLKGTSCSCTVSDMKKGEIYEIPAGGQKEVELTWNPTNPDLSLANTWKSTRTTPKTKSFP